jgi:uncharacterized protein YkwD
MPRKALRRAVLSAALLTLAVAWQARLAESQELEDEARLLHLLNEERAAHALRPLAWDPTLADLARTHADDMRDNALATHQSSGDGADFGQRLARTDLMVRAFAENVALAGDLLEAHAGLMASRGHRRNVLDPALTDVGLGIAKSSDGVVFVVEDFASVVRPLPQGQALDAARGAIELAARTAWRRPEESRRLAEDATAIAACMAQRDAVRCPEAEERGQGSAVYYTSLDPEVVPDAVVQALDHATSYGVGLEFCRTPKQPTGVYFIAVLFESGW